MTPRYLPALVVFAETRGRRFAPSRYLPALVVFALAAGCTGGERPPQPPAEASVRTALALAVGLLETRDYTGFVERFVPPAEMAQERAAGRTLDDVIATRLADPDRLLARLRQVRGASPSFHDNGTTAVFEATPQNESVRVVFRNIDGKWYLTYSG